jgi:hypothetical protein
MADSYIDKFETVLYGRFAASQILALLLGLDPELDPVGKQLGPLTASSGV